MKGISYILKSVYLRWQTFLFRWSYNSPKAAKDRSTFQSKNDRILHHHLALKTSFCFCNSFISFSYNDELSLYHKEKLAFDRNPKNPIYPAILGLLSYNLFLRSPAEARKKQCLTHIYKLETLGIFEETGLKFLYTFDDPLYGLKAPWTSGICQGLACSAFLRAYQLTQEPSYLNKAKSAIDFVLHAENKLLITGPISSKWVEEYPSNPPSFVLNGYLFFLISIIELSTFDKSYTPHAEQFLESFIKNLHAYQYKHFIAYGLAKKRLSNVLYQKIHAAQIHHLAKLCNDENLLELNHLISK